MKKKLVAKYLLVKRIYLVLPVVFFSFPSSAFTNCQDVVLTLQKNKNGNQAAQRFSEILFRNFEYLYIAKVFENKSTMTGLKEEINSCIETLSQMTDTTNLKKCAEPLISLFNEHTRNMKNIGDEKIFSPPSWLTSPEHKKLRTLLTDVTKVNEARDYIEEKINKDRDPSEKVISYLFRPSIYVGGTTSHLRFAIIDPKNPGGLIKWGNTEFSFTPAWRPKPSSTKDQAFGMFVNDPKMGLFYSGDFKLDSSTNSQEFSYHGEKGQFKNCLNCHSSGSYQPDCRTVAADPFIKKYVGSKQKDHADACKRSAQHRFGFLRAAMEDGKPQNMAARGPRLGELEYNLPGERDEKFFRKCLSRFSEGKDFLKRVDQDKPEGLVKAQFLTMQKKLKSSMSCSSCHDHSRTDDLAVGTAGELRWPMGAFEASPLHHRIQSGSMPYFEGTKLSQMERLFLSNCLTFEQYGFPVKSKNQDSLRSSKEDKLNSAFGKHLLGVSCETGQREKTKSNSMGSEPHGPAETIQ